VNRRSIEAQRERAADGTDLVRGLGYHGFI
jgi:hypothetical protein